MAITSTQQRNAVSQGAALGLLLCGCSELPFDKIRLDLAFEGAWRAWEYRSQFSQVNTDLAKGLDGYLALTRADADKQVSGVHWAREGNRWVITTRDEDWSAEDPEDVQYALGLISGDVPLQGWVSLAEDFLTRFNAVSIPR